MRMAGKSVDIETFERMPAVKAVLVQSVPAIVAQHIVNKQVVTDYTIGAAE